MLNILKTTRLAAGSSFVYQGNYFTVSIGSFDGGVRLLNSDGKNVLTQGGYPDGLPTLEYCMQLLEYYGVPALLKK